MSDFKDFDVEVQNFRDSTPEQFNGTVTTAGSPNTITPTSTKPITKAFIQNPSKGTNANSILDVLYYSIDGTSYASLTRGESITLPGIFNSILIDTNNNNTNYEIIVWS